MRGFRSKVTEKGKDFSLKKCYSPRTEGLAEEFDLSEKVTFREAERSNYKHLEAMLFAPVTANSKLFKSSHEK